MKKPVIYVPVKNQYCIELQCLASAGPNANISGMRKLYWGDDACIVKCGRYIYKVRPEDYEYWRERR